MDCKDSIMQKLKSRKKKVTKLIMKYERNPLISPLAVIKACTKGTNGIKALECYEHLPKMQQSYDKKHNPMSGSGQQNTCRAFT